jgi:hypothetical protein
MAAPAILEFRPRILDGFPGRFRVIKFGEAGGGTAFQVLTPREPEVLQLTAKARTSATS